MKHNRLPIEPLRMSRTRPRVTRARPYLCVAKALCQQRGRYQHARVIRRTSRLRVLRKWRCWNCFMDHLRPKSTMEMLHDTQKEHRNTTAKLHMRCSAPDLPSAGDTFTEPAAQAHSAEIQPRVHTECAHSIIRHRVWERVHRGRIRCSRGEERREQEQGGTSDSA